MVNHLKSDSVEEIGFVATYYSFCMQKIHRTSPRNTCSERLPTKPNSWQWFVSHRIAPLMEGTHRKNVTSETSNALPCLVMNAPFHRSPKAKSLSELRQRATAGKPTERTFGLYLFSLALLAPCSHKHNMASSPPVTRLFVFKETKKRLHKNLYSVCCALWVRTPHR